MKERLEIIQNRYDYLNEELLKPEVYENYKKMQEISKEKNSEVKKAEGCFRWVRRKRTILTKWVKSR